MTWEQSVLAVLEDLEQQAAGLQLVERDAEVAEMTAAEYARIALGERLHASLDADLRVRLVGGHQVAGRLSRVGADWLLLVDRATEHVVRTAGLVSVAGLSRRADHESTWSVVDRLSLRSILRRLASEPGSCVVHAVDGQQLRGRLGRVGQDFVELLVGEGAAASTLVLPFASVTAFQGES